MMKTIQIQYLILTAALSFSHLSYSDSGVSIPTAQESDVLTYVINGKKVFLDEDGLEIEDGEFFSYCNFESQAILFARDVKITAELIRQGSRRGKSCLSLKEESYFRTATLPVWGTVNYKLYENRIMQDGKVIYTPGGEDSDYKLSRILGNLICNGAQNIALYEYLGITRPY